MVAGSTIADTHVVHPDGTGDYPTIQAAIDAAVDGDVIELTDGTFTGEGNQHIDYLGKAITIVGQNGPEVTIIDGAAEASVVSFENGEGPTSVLESVTIMNGDATDDPYFPCGGGVFSLFSSPTIRSCTFHSNIAEYGGGMFCWGRSPTVTDCTFHDNDATEEGGGIYSAEADLKIYDCVFFENAAGGYQFGRMGGAINLSAGSLQMDDCEIRNNSARLAGGGIHSYDCTLTVTDCVLIENSAGGGSNYYGGGAINISRGSLYMRDCEISSNTSNYGGGFSMNLFADVTLDNCTIELNSAENWGGAIQNTQCFITMTDCLVAENSCVGPGGAIYLYHCEDEPYVTLTRCTLLDNVAGGSGGALACDRSGLNLDNCTLSGNETSSFGGGVLLQNESHANLERTIIAFSTGEAVSCWGYSQATCACCNLYGNSDGDWTACLIGQHGVNGNFSADPLFCGGADGSVPTLHTDVSPFSLQMTSPCLPGNHPDDYDCGVIGAHKQGCGPVEPGNDPSPPMPGEEVTVEATTWGRIKAGYR
jgi:predicted outer membrane repeat protein